MAEPVTTNLDIASPKIFSRQKKEILEVWVNLQLGNITMRRDLIDTNELRAQSERFLDHFVAAISTGNLSDTSAPSYGPILAALEQISRDRAQQGFSPSETATFVFSLKEALLPALSTALAEQPQSLVPEMLAINRLLDQLGLVTYETFVRSRETVIARQALDLLEASTPIIEVWDGVLALPLIGTLDSRRTQMVMETLLNRMIANRANVAIIDITGVPTVDTLVAQHLLKTVTAIRLLGAESVITGISAAIAQTMVHLGIDLTKIVTRSVMADGIRYALAKRGQTMAASA